MKKLLMVLGLILTLLLGIGLTACGDSGNGGGGGGGLPPNPCAFTAAQSKIVYSRGPIGSENIWMMKPDGTCQTQVTTGSNGDTYPALSYSGDLIYFGRNSNVYSINIWGQNLVQVTTSGNAGHIISISPDDATILYGKSDKIYKNNVAGTAEVCLTCAWKNAFSTDISPTGAIIAFAADTNGTGCAACVDLYTMDLNGNNKTLLYDHPTASSQEAMGRYSPDGSKIVAQLLPAAGGSDLFVINADGSNLVNIVSTPASIEGGPCWLADGSKIIFYSDEGGTSNLWSVNPDGTNRQQVTFNPERTLYNYCSR